MMHPMSHTVFRLGVIYSYTYIDGTPRLEPAVHDFQSIRVGSPIHAHMDVHMYHTSL